MIEHGWQGAALKALGAKDVTLEVTERTEITEQYLRLGFRDGGLLERVGVHPTMWVRLWFLDAEGRHHQRAFTVINPDVERGTFDIEFRLHEGAACDWARIARPGDTIAATFQGSKFAWPAGGCRRAHLVGDAASTPAINTLLDDLDPDVPVSVWLEDACDDDAAIPLRTRPGVEVTRVPRNGVLPAGEALVTRVCGDLDERFRHGRCGAGSCPDDLYWVSTEASTTRVIAKHLRGSLGVQKGALHATGYWRVD